MEKKKYSKVARIVVKDGTYTKDGVEKTRWQDVGVLMATEHGSNMFIRLNATATSPSTILSVFKEDGIEFDVKHADEGASDPSMDIDVKDIPF